MIRRTILASALAVAIAVLPSCPETAETPPPDPGGPNVLLIVLDTMRSDVFGCYGHPGALTPRLDRLARESTLYTRFYATNFWTLPTHASLLTGLYPTQCQATSETNHLPEHVTTLAERLSDAGYATGAVVHNAWISRERGFAQGFQDFTEAWRDRARSPVMAERKGADRAGQWIKEHADSPFFLLVNFNIVHMPYTPSARMFQSVRSREWPRERVQPLRRITGMWSHLAGRLRLTESDYRILRELYEAEVAHADSFVGRVLDALEETGRTDDTIVIVTSDHGENLGEHGMIDHLLSMYETTLHLPLIIRYPKRFAPGSKVSGLTSQVDVVPTVLDVCGLPPTDHGALLALGRSLADEDFTPPDYVVAENDRPVNGVELMKANFPEFDVSTIDHPIRTLITARHKLVWHLPDRTELYDLVADPGELRDIANENPELRRRLHGTLEHWTKVTSGSLRAVGACGGGVCAAEDELRGLTYIK